MEGLGTDSAAGRILAEAHDGWLAAGLGLELPAAIPLLRHARTSAIGRRLLLRSLPAPSLLAPQPQGGFGACALQWPRMRMRPRVRRLGILAFAPAIRSEISRDRVHRLRSTLGTEYALAMDRGVWSGDVDPAVSRRLREELDRVLSAPQTFASATEAQEPLPFDRQGLSELAAWASTREPALAEWARLLYPPGPCPTPHLPTGVVSYVLAKIPGEDYA